LILFAAMLKYYPAACLAAILRPVTRARIVGVMMVIVLFGVYLAMTRADLRAVMAKTLRGDVESYGVTVAADKIPAAWNASAATGATVPPWRLDPMKRQRVFIMTTCLSMALAFALAGWRSLRNILAVPANPVAESAGRLFIAGSSIYVATFLLGHNWSYRLLFLVWIMPQLGYWLQSRSRAARLIAGVTIVLTFALCWSVSAKSAVDALRGQYLSLLVIFPLTLLSAAIFYGQPDPKPNPSSHERPGRGLGDSLPARAANHPQ
jgi:hypothetical protein